MRSIVPMVVLMLISPALAGCTEEEVGPDSNVENFHVYVDGWTSDDTICQTAIFVEGGQMYVCSFSLPAEEYIVVELEIVSGSDPIDLITMDDLNLEKWKDDDSYYYLEDWTDFGTYSGEYGKDILMPEGDWNVVIYNVPS